MASISTERELIAAASDLRQDLAGLFLNFLGQYQVITDVLGVLILDTASLGGSEWSQLITSLIFMSSALDVGTLDFVELDQTTTFW